MPDRTKARTVRVPDDLWDAAQQKARARSDSLSQVLRDKLREYVAEGRSPSGHEYVNSYDRDAPVPEVGTEWFWVEESGRREEIKVLEVKWNGEEWWVRTTAGLDSSKTYWNDIGVFWEHALRKYINEGER